MLKSSLQKRFKMWFDLASLDEKEVLEFGDFGDHTILFKVMQKEAVENIDYVIVYEDDTYGGMVEIDLDIKIDTTKVIPSRPILAAARCLDALCMYGDNIFRYDFEFDAVTKNTHFYLMADNEKDNLDLKIKFEDYGIKDYSIGELR